MLGLTGYLACHGLAMGTILDYVRPLDHGESLLLVGSVAEGLASPRSDIDLLLITDDADDHPRDDLLRSMPTGCDLNIEAIGLSRAEALCGSFARLLAEARHYSGRDVLSLSFAGADELRLLHRLRTGIPLTTPAGMVDDLRRAHPMHALPDFVVLQHVACHLRLRTDAVQAVADPHTALLMSQLAAHHLIGALLASVGETNPNPKWLLRLLNDHGRALHRYPLDRLIALALPGADRDPREQIDTLLSVSSSLLELLHRDSRDNASPVANALGGLMRTALQDGPALVEEML